MITRNLTWIVGILLISTMIFAVSCGSSEPAPTPAPIPAPQPLPGKPPAPINEPPPASAPSPAPALAPTPAPAPQEKAPEVKIMKWDSPPAMAIDTSKQYTAIMETEKGKMVIELFAEDVPLTVNNFVFLAREGFYDGVTFHRVIPGFMAQGGDQTGTGTGGPGYKFADEFTGHRHVTGALSMANSGADTNGSQFFICYSLQRGLDGKHSVFGQIIEGMEVLLALTVRDPNQNPQFEGDKIIRITIEES